MSYQIKQLRHTLPVRNQVDRRSEYIAYLIQNRSAVQYFQNKKIGILLIEDKDAPLQRFAHPVFIDGSSKDIVGDTSYVIADIRGLRREEAEVMKRYAHHIAVWETPEIKDDFSSLTLLPFISYVNWVTSVFSNRYNLTAAEAQGVGVVFSLFYLAQSKPCSELLSPQNVNTTLSRISQATGLPERPILDILELVDEDHFSNEAAPNLYALTLVLKALSPRLEKLMSPETIIAPLSPTFMGSRGPALASVAVEYPPAFLTLLVTVLEDRTYQRCTIKKVVGERVLTGRYKRLGDEFLRSYVWYNNQYFS